MIDSCDSLSQTLVRQDDGLEGLSYGLSSCSTTQTYISNDLTQARWQLLER